MLSEGASIFNIHFQSHTVLLALFLLSILRSIISEDHAGIRDALPTAVHQVVAAVYVADVPVGVAEAVHFQLLERPMTVAAVTRN